MDWTGVSQWGLRGVTRVGAQLASARARCHQMPVETPPSARKQQYPFALTGGALLILATAAVFAAFLFPFAELNVDLEGGAPDLSIEYAAATYKAKADGEKMDSGAYHDDEADGAAGIAALRTGTWALGIGGFLAFSAAFTLFAAPSAGLAAARGAGWVGLAAGILLVAATVALFVGFSDHARHVAEASGADYDTRLMPGVAYLGAAVALALGGAVLGFSDKPTNVAGPIAS